MTAINVTKPTGRPKGSLNGSRMIMPWRPLEWKPVYETMVALHCVGYTNIEIAKQYEYTTVQIGNIIRSPEAQKIIVTYKDNLRKNTTEGEVETLAKIKRTAIKRVEDLICNDDLASDHPFRMADFSITLLKGLGALSDTNNQSPGPAAPTVNNIMIGNDIAQKLLDGMSKAAEARRLNALPASVIANKTEVVVVAKE